MNKWPGDIPEARAEMTELRSRFNLGFMHNPGGGEFNGDDGFHCQIGGMHDGEDLEALKHALRAKGWLKD